MENENKVSWEYSKFKNDLKSAEEFRKKTAHFDYLSWFESFKKRLNLSDYGFSKILSLYLQESKYKDSRVIYNGIFLYMIEFGTKNNAFTTLDVLNLFYFVSLSSLETKEKDNNIVSSKKEYLESFQTYFRAIRPILREKDTKVLKEMLVLLKLHENV